MALDVRVALSGKLFDGGVKRVHRWSVEQKRAEPKLRDTLFMAPPFALLVLAESDTFSSTILSRVATGPLSPGPSPGLFVTTCRLADADADHVRS